MGRHFDFPTAPSGRGKGPVWGRAAPGSAPLQTPATPCYGVTLTAQRLTDFNQDQHRSLFALSPGRRTRFLRELPSPVVALARSVAQVISLRRVPTPTAAFAL